MNAGGRPRPRSPAGRQDHSLLSLISLRRAPRRRGPEPGAAPVDTKAGLLKLSGRTLAESVDYVGQDAVPLIPC